MSDSQTNHKLTNGRHWKHIYVRNRRRALGINSKQMAWSQVISLLGSVVAGVLLETNKETLALLVGAFVVLPGVFDLDGSIGAALSAKINHKLEKDGESSMSVLIKSTLSAMMIAALAGLIVAGVGAAIAVWLFGANFGQVFWLAENAILLSALIGFPLIGTLAVIFRHFKVNPDDVVGPIESSVFDILTIITMVLVIGWLT